MEWHENHHEEKTDQALEGDLDEVSELNLFFNSFDDVTPAHPSPRSFSYDPSPLWLPHLIIFLQHLCPFLLVSIHLHPPPLTPFTWLPLTTIYLNTPPLAPSPIRAL